MKSLIVLLCIIVLSGCGLSDGDEVLVLPNDKPMRSDSFEGIVARVDDEVITVLDSKGRLLTYTTDEVFPIGDEDAKAQSDARVRFYKTLDKNYNTYFDSLSFTDEGGKNSSIGEILIDQAKEAGLDEWVATFQMHAALVGHLKRYAYVDDVTMHELAEESIEFLDGDEVEELELALNKLSNPESVKFLADMAPSLFMRFAEHSLSLLMRQNSKSDSELTTQFGRIKNQDDTQLTIDGFGSIDNIKPAIENARIYVDLIVESKRHIRLATGQEYSEKELEELRVETKNRLYRAALPHALKFARKELKSSIPSVALAEKVMDITGINKEDLASLHHKDSWGDLLSEIKAAKSWQTNFIDDGWEGVFEIPKRSHYGAPLTLSSTLSLFMSNSSLYELKAKLRASSSRGDVHLVGDVTSSEGKITITDKQGDWNWSAAINGKGQLVADGKVPYRRYLYNVNVVFSSPEMFARKERERQAKIEEFKHVLTSDLWYGVVFRNNQPTSTAIRLDFNKKAVEFLNVTNSPIEKNSTKFDFYINDNGKGVITESKGVSIKGWRSGDKWDFIVKNKGKNLDAEFVQKRPFSRTVSYHVNYVRESAYNENLGGISEKGGQLDVVSTPPVINTAQAKQPVLQKSEPAVNAENVSSPVSNNLLDTLASSNLPVEQKPDRKELYKLGQDYVKRLHLSRRSSGESALDVLDQLGGGNQKDSYEEKLRDSVITKYLDLAESKMNAYSYSKASSLISKAQKIAYTNRAASLQIELNGRISQAGRVGGTQPQVQYSTENSAEVLNNVVNEGAKALGGLINGLFN